ncbi:MAG: sulfur carrier protein ThiS [Nitrospinota bacterium]
MTITVNGKTRELDESLTLTELVKSIGLSEKHVVIEYNLEPLERERYESTRVKDGDNIEIVTMMAGG